MPEVAQDISSNKAVEVPKDGAASQGFEKALASTTLPAGGVQKEKEKDVPSEAPGKALQPKLQIRLNK